MRFEALRETLLAGGIAPRHVRRYLAELSEHLEDLTAEQRGQGFDSEDAAIRARARLGSDAELAHAMLAHKEFRSWAVRAPLAVFGVLPPAVLLLAGFVVVAPIVLYAKVAGLTDHHWIGTPGWFQMLVAVTFLLGNLTLAPLLATGFVWLGVRQRLRSLWPLLAVLLIALMDLQFRAHFPASGQHGGAVSISAALWMDHFHSLTEEWRLSLTQLLLTLTPALWLLQQKAVTR